MGSIDNYDYGTDDYVMVAIGNVKVRNGIIDKLVHKGANFFTYIHSSVFVADNAVIGEGSIICPFSMAQANSKIGKHCVLNIYCSVSHDSILGDNSILSPYCTLNGNVRTGKNLFMGTRSTLLLNSSVGKNCIISAHTIIKGVVKDNYMVQDKVNKIQVINRLSVE